MKKALVTSIVLCVSALVFCSNPVFAHYASITLDKYNPSPGDEITVNIGWGHKFPGDGEMRKEAYSTTVLEIINPDGRKHTLAIVPKQEKGNEPIKVILEQAGTYTILLTQKNFSTKTTKGYKYQPKNELKNVLHSRWGETVSKAVVTAGPAGKKFNSKNIDTGDRFQIVPLENPINLEKGDVLPVKVTLNGKPWSGMVYSTYEGFSDASDTFAYTTRADKQGIAKIKILENALWLIKADHSYPYEDKSKADEYSFKATLTFKN